MKKAAYTLRIGETIKFSNVSGTHTMKLTNVEYAFNNKEIQVHGEVIKTTNKHNIGQFQEGNQAFNFFRVRTKVQVID